MCRSRCLHVPLSLCRSRRASARACLPAESRSRQARAGPSGRRGSRAANSQKATGAQREGPGEAHGRHGEPHMESGTWPPEPRVRTRLRQQRPAACRRRSLEARGARRPRLRSRRARTALNLCTGQTQNLARREPRPAQGPDGDLHVVDTLVKTGVSLSRVSFSHCRDGDSDIPEASDKPHSNDNGGSISMAIQTKGKHFSTSIACLIGIASTCTMLQLI